jgi:hypothetical protein
MASKAGGKARECGKTEVEWGKKAESTLKWLSD